MILLRSSQIAMRPTTAWLAGGLLLAISTACAGGRDAEGASQPAGEQWATAGTQVQAPPEFPGDIPGASRDDSGGALSGPAVSSTESGNTAEPGASQGVGTSTAGAGGGEPAQQELLEAAMLTVPEDLVVVSDPSLRLDTDPEDYLFPKTVGGIPVRILREYHPTSGVLMRIKSVREDSVDSDSSSEAVLHGPEWAYFNTAALASVRWWKDNVAHGPVQIWWRVGTRKSEGRFIDGERDGLQQGYTKSGLIISRGSYRAGRRVGLHEEWFASGQLKSSESYVDGQLDGTRRVWGRNGLLMQLQNFRGGKQHGRWSDFHPAGGNPRTWGEFDYGARTGVWERGSIDEVVLESSTFINDRRDGVTKKWSESGQLIEEATYVIGVQTGPRRTWYDDGTLQSEGMLEDGLRTGYWLYQKADGESNEIWSGEYQEDQRVGPGSPPK